MSADEVERVFAQAREQLGGTPREALGVLREPRRILGVPRAARVARAGEAWHLGVLLLTDEAVLATGDVIRARAETTRGFAAESQRARAALAAAASRGGFADGDLVHLGWKVLDLGLAAENTSPLALRDGVPSVRWSAAGAYVPLRAYLQERIELLLHPLERA